jgi:hypothetical protein
MATMRFILVLVGVLFVCGAVFAGCAQDAYNKACASCSFDSQGKMDQQCYQGYQASGTACVSTTYPTAAAEYAAGKCPGIDTCASALQACKAQTASGNDSEDCNDGVMAQCFHEADSCVTKAAANCGEKIPCINAPASFVLVVGASLFYYNKKD